MERIRDGSVKEVEEAERGREREYPQREKQRDTEGQTDRQTETQRQYFEVDSTLKETHTQSSQRLRQRVSTLRERKKVLRQIGSEYSQREGGGGGVSRLHNQKKAHSQTNEPRSQQTVLTRTSSERRHSAGRYAGRERPRERPSFTQGVSGRSASCLMTTREKRSPCSAALRQAQLRRNPPVPSLLPSLPAPPPPPATGSLLLSRPVESCSRMRL